MCVCVCVWCVCVCVVFVCVGVCVCLCGVCVCFGATAPSGPGLPHSRGFWILYKDAPQSVGLHWMIDKPIAETSLWQHTTFSIDKPLCRRWDSNPQSQHASGRRPTPWTEWPPGPAYVCVCIYIYIYLFIYIYIYIGTYIRVVISGMLQIRIRTFRNVNIA